MFLQGRIDQDLVYRLTPEIVRIQHTGRDPITVYIDSPGGGTMYAAQILDLLRAPSLDSSTPCRLITVGTSLAGSAAASLLSAGDYALVYPDTRLHFHGLRVLSDAPITVERASDAAKDLRESNNRAAVTLARDCNLRFFFRFVTLRPEFGAYRERTGKRDCGERDCFVGLISEKLSSWGLAIVSKAEQRTKRYASLWDSVVRSRNVAKQLANMANFRGQGEATTSDQIVTAVNKLQAEVLRSIVTFELKANKARPGWGFASAGVSQVQDDFLLLNEYIGHHQNEWIEIFCEQWKDVVLDPADKQAIDELPEAERKAALVEKLTPVLLPIWLFLGAVCHVLQEAENPLTSHDAFWLGLVDEVIGANLPTLRKVVEQGPSSQKRKASKEAMTRAS
ncbi:MAG TPA: ATP-dependent Clp protease proteolytic subunit [Bryobacteraceae bacterium]|nr:ATP-dependent Clp protease proteolytic subunit [Bryobacteraceae bacterium]